MLVLAEIVCAAMVGTARSAFGRFKPETGALVAGSATVLVGLGLAVSIPANPASGIARLGCLWHDCEWAPSHVQRVASRLNEILGPGSPNLRTATLMSIYPLEAGFGIYDELAGAPFFYRVNDTLSKERLRSLNGVAPDEIATWLADKGATAVLTGYTSGYDVDLEAGFVRFARDHGLIPFPIDLRGGYKQDEDSDNGVLWVLLSLFDIRGTAGAATRACRSAVASSARRSARDADMGTVSRAASPVSGPSTRSASGGWRSASR